MISIENNNDKEMPCKNCNALPKGKPKPAHIVIMTKIYEKKIVVIGTRRPTYDYVHTGYICHHCGKLELLKG